MKKLNSKYVISKENQLIIDFMEEHHFCKNNYSTSWDLLMPVIEKIKKLENVQYNVDTAAWVYAVLKDYKSHVSNKLRSSWLENNFNSVVMFLRYYNIFVIKTNEKDINKKSNKLVLQKTNSK